MDKEEHQKYYNDKGVELPSCTQIVSLLNKPELVGWANYMGFQRVDTKKLLNDKARYGTYCHKLAECYFRDGLLTAKTNADYIPKEEYRHLIYKFRVIDLFFQKHMVRSLRNEFQVTGSSYGGTMDMVCYDECDDCLIIFDFKTSKRIYNSHWIQLMGYAGLLEEVYQLPVKKVGVILLSEPMDSKKLITMELTENLEREKKIFYHLTKIYHCLHPTKGEVKCNNQNYKYTQEKPCITNAL